MKKKRILLLLSFLMFFSIYLISWKILKLSFQNMNEPFRAMISGGLTAILSPRIKIYKTQSGEKFQLNWIVLKKSINL